MKLYKLDLELTDIYELDFSNWRIAQGDKFTMTETGYTTPNGYQTYYLIGTKEILLDFLERFYDEDEEFFNEIKEII